MSTGALNCHYEMKPFSQACANNQDAILSVLKRAFADQRKVLEIGSGTGQHAVYFAEHLRHLEWYTSDMAENHTGINLWVDESVSDNLHRPCLLNVTDSAWRAPRVDAVFSANTFHIMSWQAVQAFFSGLAAVLSDGGILAVYGPFNYNGEYTSESNERFDVWLKAQAVHQSIRDFEKVDTLAHGVGFSLIEDNTMPANNRLLVWKRDR